MGPRSVAGWVVFVLASACGGGDATENGDRAAHPDAISSAPSDAVAHEWTPLVSGEWLLSPGEEVLSARYEERVDRDVFVGGVRPLAPEGTHHSVLSIDGPFIGDVLYGSGIGTNSFVFPEGVALKIPAGKTLVLTLHLFNGNLEPLAGTSGVEIIELDRAEVVHDADQFNPGPLDFEIPPLTEHTHTGVCTIEAEQTIFALFPHMHAMGVHLRTTLTSGGVTRVLHDAPFDFEHQAIIPFEPITLKAGDTITTTCTWRNPRSVAIRYGGSSTAEMCASILSRYPARDDGMFCDDA